MSETAATTGLPPIRPDRPLALTSQVAADDDVDLGWLDQATNETAYSIQRRDGLTGEWGTIDTVNQANLQAYTDESSEADHTYYYRIIAVTADAASDPSDPTCVTTSLQAPTGVTATPLPSGEVRLDWVDQSPNETSFQIFRSLDGGTTRELVLTVPAHDGTGGTQAVVGGLTEGQPVSFYVVAATADRATPGGGGTGPTTPRQNRLAIIHHSGPIDHDGPDPYSISVEPHGLTGTITWQIDWGDTHYEANASPVGHAGNVYTFQHVYEIPKDGLERRYGLVITAKNNAGGKLTLGPTVMDMPAYDGNQMSHAQKLRRDIQEAFDFVHNNIYYEPYSGAVKGAAATEGTSAGNDWDQDVLLLDKIKRAVDTAGSGASAGATYSFNTKRITVDINLVEDWLGFAQPQSSAAKARIDSAAVRILLVASKGIGQERNGDFWAQPNLLNYVNGSPTKINFCQTFLHVEIPYASIKADFAPAWKFRDLKSGVASVGGSSGVVFDLEQFLDDSSSSPSDWYLDHVASYLNTEVGASRTTKKSIADVSRDGPIRVKHMPPITEVPIALPDEWLLDDTGHNVFNAGPTPSEMAVTSESTPPPKANFSKRIRITYNEATALTLDTSEVGAAPVTVRYASAGNNYSVRLFVGDRDQGPLGTVSKSADSVKIWVDQLWLGYVVDTIIPDNQTHVEYDVSPGDPFAIMIQASQVSASDVAKQ